MTSSNKNVLIVDDSRVVRTVSRRIMEPLGYQVAEAEDGAKALDFCKNNPLPQLILLDWNMPVMNGMEFITSFRALPNTEGTVVIFCTTENELPNIMKALEAGANEYIMKPFDDVILKEKLSLLGLLDS